MVRMDAGKASAQVVQIAALGRQFEKQLVMFITERESARLWIGHGEPEENCARGQFLILADPERHGKGRLGRARRAEAQKGRRKPSNGACSRGSGLRKAVD